MKKTQGVIQGGCIFFLTAIFGTCFGVAGDSRVLELSRLSIEELISIKVTSVMKIPQSWSKTPAAIYVVTQEDIRRSGAENVPDLLRMVPGVQVAEIDEDIYAISIRGFNDAHANKLLVMVDGRSIYNHIFSGVIWSYMNVVMEDIDRIEIIRGPGSSVWGANAVNGVINIITKKTEDTKGMFAGFSGGYPGRVSGTVRYGGEIGNNAGFRIYARGYENHNDHLSQTGDDAGTVYNSVMTGFRTDWDVTSSDNVFLHGEMSRYASDTVENNPIIPDKLIRSVDTDAYHLLGRWRHTFSESSEAAWRIYHQHEKRREDYEFDTTDIDFQHDFKWKERHQFVWGLGYGFISDEMIKGLLGRYTYNPVKRDQSLFSFFLQDTVQLSPDYLNLTLGSKYEHNDYTGSEIQPGIRISWTPHERHIFWGAVSRSVRTPSRIDSHATAKQGSKLSGATGPPLNAKAVRGSEDFESEELIAYELGYRLNPRDAFNLDFAVFYNVYDKLFTYEEREPGIWEIVNDMEGETYGIEITADYRPVDWWRLSGCWSYLEMDMRLKNDQAADLTEYVEETNPKHQASLHSAFNIRDDVELDLSIRHVDSIGHHRPALRLASMPGETGDYTEIDIRLAWKPVRNVELSLNGKNLGGGHREFSNYEIDESILFKVKIGFGN